MKNTTKMVLKFIVFAVLFTACSSTNCSIHFKHQSGQTGIYEADPNGQQHYVLGDTTSYSLESKPSILIDEFAKLEISDECYADELCIDFRLSERGTKEYESLTRRNLNRQIFYVIDGVIIAAPEAAGVIRSGMGQFPIPESMFDSLFVER